MTVCFDRLSCVPGMDGSVSTKGNVNVIAVETLRQCLALDINRTLDITRQAGLGAPTQV